MNIDTADDDGGNTAGPVDHIEASGGALNQITSNHDVDRQEPRPGQSASRNRAQSGWDVMPFVPKCGMPCLMCVLPAIAPGEGTSSDRPMTILRTFAFIMIYTNFTVSRSEQSLGKSPALCL